MHQKIEEQAERLIALGLSGGALALGIGFLLIILGLVTQAGIVIALGTLAILVGLGGLGGALWMGLDKNKRQFEGPPQTYEDVKIVSRQAYDERAQLVYSDWDLQEEGVRFYVKIELAAGNRVEFECARETFYSCGEGSRGDAHIQGKWLSQFITRVGAV